MANAAGSAELAIGQTSLVQMLTEVEDYAAALIESPETSVCGLSIDTCALSYGRAKRSALSSAPVPHSSQCNYDAQNAQR